MYGPTRKVIGKQYVSNIECKSVGGGDISGSAWLLVLECGHIDICSPYMDHRDVRTSHCVECKEEGRE